MAFNCSLSYVKISASDVFHLSLLIANADIFTYWPKNALSVKLYPKPKTLN